MPKVRELETICVVDLDGRSANLERNLQRGLPWAGREPEREGQLAIVGSGPSVRTRLDKLRQWPGEIWAINGAYDYLLTEGIIPHGFWGIDPLPGLAGYVKNARPETTFYIAATCDPSVFDALAGHKVVLWFPACEQDASYPEDAVLVTGGVTVLTRAPYGALMMGWRDITIFGADSSFDEDDDRRYCYQHGTYAEDSQAIFNVVTLDGETRFLTEINLMKQVANFGVIHNQFRGMLKFDCDGLMAAWLEAPTQDIVDRHGNLTAHAA